MRRHLVPVFVALVLLAGPRLSAMMDWTAPIPSSKSVARLEMLAEGEESPGICSGVVINTDPAYVLTAAHCVEHKQSEALDMTVNGRYAEVARVSRLLDLAVVSFTAKDEVAMPLADKLPAPGTEIAVIGYAFGIKAPIPQFGHVSQTMNPESGYAWLNVDLIFGDSGGAVIDGEGRLVGVNSRIFTQGPAHMAGVVPVEVVRDFIPKQWLPKSKHVAAKGAK